MNNVLTLLYIGNATEYFKPFNQKDNLSFIFLEDSVKAINHLESDKSVDAILCDFMLPGNNGLYLYEWIKDNSKHKEVPFILLSKEFSDKIYKRSFKKRVNDYYVISETAAEDIIERVKFLHDNKGIISSANLPELVDEEYKMPWSKRIFDIAVASAVLLMASPFLLLILGFYGMMISGTRGAIAVPFAGVMMFLVLKKNIKILSIGLIGVVLLYVFFRFTMIGNGNAQIRRMRTGFDPNNKSLQVRLDNQKILKGYLASRPFGGGLGHAGDKAQRFLPHAFLSNVATDSWYVVIWAELGIVGLYMHLIILFYIIGTGSYKVMFRIRDPIVKLRMSAFICGMAGVMLGSYGNQVLGSMPTSLCIYTSMYLMLNPKVFETYKKEKELKLNPA
ncbi:MAG: O-antigen ligase family protein [Jejuia sp.]